MMRDGPEKMPLELEETPGNSCQSGLATKAIDQFNSIHPQVAPALTQAELDDKIITTEQEPNPIVSTEAVAAAPPEQELEEQEPSSAEPLTT